MIQPTDPRDLDRGLEALYYTLVGQQPSTTRASRIEGGVRVPSTSHVPATSGAADTQEEQRREGDQACSTEREGWRRVLGRVFGLEG
jgi:hypothetical protein